MSCIKSCRGKNLLLSFVAARSVAAGMRVPNRTLWG